MRFSLVSSIFHFSANVSGETPFRIVDEIELMFTCSIHDDVKALILTWVLGVGVVVFEQSFMHSGLAIGMFVFCLVGKGTLTLRTP